MQNLVDVGQKFVLDLGELFNLLFNWLELTVVVRYFLGKKVLKDLGFCCHLPCVNVFISISRQTCFNKHLLNGEYNLLLQVSYELEVDLFVKFLALLLNSLTHLFQWLILSCLVRFELDKLLESFTVEVNVYHSCDFKEHDIVMRLLIQLFFIELHVDDAVSDITNKKLNDLSLAHLDYLMLHINLHLSTELKVLIDLLKQLDKFSL